MKGGDKMKGIGHFIQHANDRRRGQIRFFIGAFLAIMGFFWLSKKAGWFPCETHNSSLFWPIVVLVVGAVLLFGRHVRARHGEQK